MYQGWYRKYVKCQRRRYRDANLPLGAAGSYTDAPSSSSYSCGVLPPESAEDVGKSNGSLGEAALVSHHTSNPSRPWTHSTHCDAMPAEEDPEKGQGKAITIWPQWLAAGTLSLAVIVSGLSNGWTSPYMAQLTSPDAEVPFRMTETEAAWVASLLNLGRVVGAIVGALCQEYAGRKRVLLLGALPLASSWVFSICATSVGWLYAARFSSGIGSGMIWPALSLYLGEIADPKIRGSLISMNINVASVGLFLGNAMGPYLSMEMFGYVSLVPNILFLILFSLIPESPYHYILHGELEEAEASLRWFRRRTDVKSEMLELQEFVQGADTDLRVKLKEFFLPGNLKKALTLLGIYALAYASGYNALSSYAEIIVEKSGIDLTPSTVVMVLGFSTIVAGATATLAVDKFGRKWLLIVSSFGVAVSLIMLGVHFHLLEIGLDGRALTWLPVTALLIFNLFVSYGLVPVPSALLSEMFPANLKNIASLVISTNNSVMAFLCIRSYQPFLDLVGDRFVFWTYGSIVFLAIPYVHFLIPETAGKSLLEIQRSGKH